MSNENVIKKLLQLGKSQRAIALELGITRSKVSKTVKDWAKEATALQPSKFKLDDYRKEIIDWLEQQKLTAQLIYDRLAALGVDVSYATVTRYIHALKKEEVYVPVLTDPGEEAQVDFGYLGEFYQDGKKVKVWVFNMVLSYSRYAYYREVTNQTLQTFLKCHMEAFEFFGGAPAIVKIDNLKSGVLQADLYEPLIQREYAIFLAYYGALPLTARPRRGQDKGKVESGIKYVKNNFLKSLLHRDFKRLSRELSRWNNADCNLRIHGTTRKIPAKMFIQVEKPMLKPLPLERYRFLEIQERKVGPYGHIYFRYNYYSVPHQFTGLIVQVECDGAVLKILKDNQLLTMHVVSSDTGQFITVDSHKPPHKQGKSREEFMEKMQEIGHHASSLLEAIQEQRPRHWHSMARGILSLQKTYATGIINSACKKAISLTSFSYQTVKHICENCTYEREQVVIVPSGTGDHYHELSSYDRLIN